MIVIEEIKNLAAKAGELAVYKREVFAAFNSFVLFCFIFVPLELVLPLRKKNILRKQSLTDVAWLFIHYTVPKIPIYIGTLLLAWMLSKVLPRPIYLWGESLPVWAAFPAAVVIGELGAYWGHRLAHEIPFLWKFHAIHHGAEEMDWLVNTRAHPVDVIFTRLCAIAPSLVLGLTNPLKGSLDWVLLGLGLVQSFWAFFIHANVKCKLRWLAPVISTPAFHHWHHTNDGPAYINKNYAGLCSFWDIVFGTYYLPKDKLPQSYGISEYQPGTVVGQFIYPLLSKKMRKKVEMRSRAKALARETLSRDGKGDGGPTR